MATRNLAKNELSRDEDWYRNNVAMTCPVCQQSSSYLVSLAKAGGIVLDAKSSSEITDELVKVEWPEELLDSTALLRAIGNTISPPAGGHAVGSPRVCIFGTHHAYQYKTVRRRYFQNVHDLITIHGVDLVAEEFSAPGQTSYAEKIAGLHGIPWANVDLTGGERKHVPDLNLYSIGTQIDADLQSLREWVWVVRTAKAMKLSSNRTTMW